MKTLTRSEFGTYGFVMDGMAITGFLTADNTIGQYDPTCPESAEIPKGYGFSVVTTGGCCTAWYQAFLLDGRPVHMRITDTSGVTHEVEPADRVVVGIYEGTDLGQEEVLVWEQDNWPLSVDDDNAPVILVQPGGEVSVTQSNNTPNAGALPEPGLKKRTWHYAQPPAAFGIAPCSCGNTHTQWSEFAKHLWCANCEKDFVPEHGGIFDGPIAIQLSALLGISFDRVDIATQTLQRFNTETLEYDLGMCPSTVKTSAQMNERIKELVKQATTPSGVAGLGVQSLSLIPKS